MPKAELQDRNILVVDDHDLFRSLIVTMLTTAGFGVVEAGDGPTALDLYRDRMTEIDCVLLDLSMPKMSGSQVMAAIHKLNAGARIIVMSGHDDSAAKYLIEYGGARAYLNKPFEYDQLVATINSTITD